MCNFKLLRLRQWIAMITAAAMCNSPAAAFDTFWHSAATGAAGKALGFSADAVNIMQFGNFSGPDFFGPFYDTVLGKRVEDSSLGQFLADGQPIRKFAIFMHFDNLKGELNSNGKFDYLFNRLLANTKSFLTIAAGNPAINEGNKKMLILITLGSSLHMVQDFYSHSDWIHQDFPSLGLPLVTMPWGKPRAATWFEVRGKLGDPDKWPFKVHSGIYPPPDCDNSKDPHAASQPCQSHTRLNHDNSQLVYDGRSQLAYHDLGPIPAGRAGAAEHQLFAVNTAAGASIEWLHVIEEDPGAKNAIEYARTWDLKSYNPAMLHDLEQSLLLTLALSCGPGKWDGPKPPASRAAPCRATGMGAGAGAAGSVAGAGAATHAMLPGIGLGASGLAGMAAGGMGLSAALASVLVNEFWAIHTRYNVVEHLASGFGSQSGDYVFPQ